MRALALLAVVCLVACGRSPSTPGGGGASTEDAQQASQQRVAATGHYKFGPTVEQGFAGLPGRLADLRVDADGTFTMSFMVGCLMFSAGGPWTSQGGDAVLTIERGAWTDEEGRRLDVSTVLGTPRAPALFVPSGLEVRFTTADGRSHAQFWDQVGP